MAAHPATTTGNGKPNHTRANPSLDFFDAFGREAKEASERNKRQVLDELLLHDSDPLSFLSTKQDEAPLRQTASPGQPFTDAPSATSPSVDADEEFGELQSSAPPCSSVTSFGPSLIDFDPLAEPEKRPTLADDAASTSTDPRHHHHHHYCYYHRHHYYFTL